MNILITGGAGFIGSNLQHALQKLGHYTVLIDNLNPQIHGNDPILTSTSYQYLNRSNNFYLYTHDILDSIEVIKAKYDIVFHLAAETGTGQSMYELDKYHRTNIDATAFLLNFYLQNPEFAPKRIILSSSRAIYGDAIVKDNEIIKSKETDSPNPLSIYAANKLYQEHLFKILLLNKIDFNILRFQNVYGPYQSLNNPYTGILSIFSKEMLYDKPVFIFEDGQMTRDFVYIDDVIESLILAMNTLNVNQIYNIGSGKSTSVLNLVSMLKSLYNSNSEIILTGKIRNGDIRHNVADLTKSIKYLKYESKTDIENGLKKYTEWVKSLKIEYTNSYETSLNELKKNNLLND